MDEPYIGKTLNVTPGGKLLATPSLHACTRHSLTADPLSGIHRNLNEDELKEIGCCAEFRLDNQIPSSFKVIRCTEVNSTSPSPGTITLGPI
ncbi:hypothetical protein TNCV_1189991 [Trichonephila clavipes]|nr:hypothetical protein TNCV_1189991 [Trichonephila clavipes]